MLCILNHLNSNNKSYFLEISLVCKGENQMKKRLKLCSLLLILFIPVFLSKKQTSVYGQKSIEFPFFLLPETQNDANTGGDAGDNFGNATIIGIGPFTGSLPENDTDDFYTVYINMDRHAAITLTGDLGTDFDLHLYTPDRNPIMVSQNNDSNEFLEIDILSYGYWFVRIEKYNLTSHGNYSLLIQTSSITSTDITFLQNDANSGGDAGNTFGSATEISRGTHYGVLIDFDYYDYYKIDLVFGDIITIDLSLQAIQNFDLFFYSPAINRIASSTQGITEESISVTVSESGSFRILISRLTGQGTYELNIQISHPSELDFNWKALVVFSSVLVTIIGIFLIIRFVRNRAPTKIDQSSIKEKSRRAKQRDINLKEQEIVDCDDALVESGKDLSEEERVALEKILKGYSTGKDKE